MPLPLEERLAAATRTGGLLELPKDFGDAGGDWGTVRSENPFEVLYLDYRQASRITPEVVSRHRDLLQRFWQEKLKSMTQGAARLAILAKYGGVEQSERLVRSYPDLIERAFHRLSTIGGIEEAYREIITRQQKAFFARIDEKLDDFLIDSVLQPEETRALLALADREGVARELVAAHVQDRLRAAGLISEEAVLGATIEQQLLSSVWIHPSRKASAPPPLPPEPRKTYPLLLALIGLVLIVGVVMFLYQAQPAPSPAPVDPPAPDAPTEIDTAPSGETAGVEPPEFKPEIEPAPTQNDVAASAIPGRREEVPSPLPEVSPAPPVISLEERQAVQGDLEEIRALRADDPQRALDLVEELDSRLGERRQEFAEERLALGILKAEIQSSMERARERNEEARKREEERLARYEQSLAHIASMSQKGNFSGAKDLAEELLKEPDLPEPIALRARELADDAVRKLQEVWSGAKVKSRTKRSADPPQYRR